MFSRSHMNARTGTSRSCYLILDGSCPFERTKSNVAAFRALRLTALKSGGLLFLRWHLSSSVPEEGHSATSARIVPLFFARGNYRLMPQHPSHVYTLTAFRLSLSLSLSRPRSHPAALSFSPHLCASFSLLSAAFSVAPSSSQPSFPPRFASGRRVRTRAKHSRSRGRKELCRTPFIRTRFIFVIPPLLPSRCLRKLH